MEPTASQVEQAPTDQSHIMRLASSGGMARALAVAARLGLADHVSQGRLSYKELSARTGCDPDALLRLLLTLTLCGVCDRDANDAFGVTEQYASLRTDHPRSLRNFCVLMAETYDDAFRALETTVRTGDPGFREVFGSSLYEYLEGDPESGRIFDSAMAELARPVAAALTERYDLHGVTEVVDLGGGDGTMLTALLADHPGLTGVCADRHSVCERAAARARAGGEASPAGRIRFQPTDIFTEAPVGGDLYLLKNVLHDWSPEDCLRILTAAHRAMRRTAEGRDPALPLPRLLVLEPMFETDSDAAHALFQMVICETGTRGFGQAEMRALLDAAEFTVLSADRLPTTGHHLFECVPDIPGRPAGTAR